jgi:hypothetical protein
MGNMNHPAFNDKVINPDLAMVPFHGTEPYGEFKAIVRLARPENRPSAMKVMEIYSANLLNVRIRCDQIKCVIEDVNVLSVELREYVSKTRPQLLED